ncbi:MAG: hypothetical protein AAF741_02225 [Bacteroidota bacterium]
MLRKVGFYILAATILLIGLACEDDMISVDSTPQLELVEEISGLPGETIVFSGLLSDPAGVRDIRITYEPWFLDKVIEVTPGVTQFELAYSFLIPADEVIGSEHLVTVTAANPGDNDMTSQIRVTISGDNSQPVISISSPNDGGTFILGPGAEFSLDISANDDQGIGSVRIAGFGINEEVEVNDVSYSFNREIDFSLSGQFTVNVSVTDLAGNTSSASRTVNIEESLRFDRMFLADVDTDAELNSDVFGVPMLINGSTDPTTEGVIFEALYYNKEANQEIRFIPQKSSFAPFAFGAGPGPNELAIGTDATVNPIVLPEVAYYRIIIDFTSLTYTLETFEPTDPTFDFIILIGTGVTVNGESTCTSNADGSELCYNFGSGKELTPDPENPYRFFADIELFDYDPVGDGNNGFILGANKTGWVPFWRFDVGDAVGTFPDTTVPGGGGNFIFGPEVYGEYFFEFDTFLNRVRITPR